MGRKVNKKFKYKRRHYHKDCIQKKAWVASLDISTHCKHNNYANTELCTSLILKCLKSRGKPMSHCNVHTLIVALLSLCLFLLSVSSPQDIYHPNRQS